MHQEVDDWFGCGCAVYQRPLDRGDVLLSLSYLPTAERLVLVVVKARNLTWPTTKPVGGNCNRTAVDELGSALIAEYL